MIIKSPPCFDVSHWKEIPNFKAVDPRPILFITKASEGIGIVDEKFVRFASGMMEIGCTRAFFHFHRKAYDAVRQAQHFISVLETTNILSSDILILDVEEGGETASQLWGFISYIQRHYPLNLVMIYSRANILNPIVMTLAEREYFKRIPVWTAGYPFFPDLFSTVPKGYIPDQSKFGPVWLWQYSSHGAVTGIQGDVDMNWIAPAMQAHLEAYRINFGEFTMANYAGTCKEIAKVWSTIGGARVYPDIRVGTPVIADGKQSDYVHLISPIVGWSKTIWFTLTQVEPTPDPDPEPVPIKTHDIDVYSDGSVKVDGNSI